MPPRKSKAAESAEEEQANEAEALSDAVGRALEAARLADDAADDVDKIRKANQAMVDKVQKNSSRLMALSVGAFVGAFVALILSGLVYFRTVQDMRETTELQAEAMAQFVSQTAALQEVVQQAAVQQGGIQTTFELKTRELGDRISAEITAYANDVAEATNMQPQMASGVFDELSDQLKAQEEQLLGAIADLDVSMTSIVTESGEGVMPETITEMATLITELQLILADTRAQAEARAQQAAAASAAAQRPTSTASSTSTRRTPAPEPNPFSFP